MNYNINFDNQILSVVCCYGYLQNDKNDIEITGIKSYITDIVLDLEKKLKDNLTISAVVLSGGHTLKEKLISESQSYFDFFKSLLIEKKINLPILIETLSLNHSEHLAFSALLARNYTFNHIDIYCDKNFRYKVNALAYGLFDGLFKFDLIPIIREDIHPNNDIEIQTLDKLPKEITSLKFAKLKKYLSSVFN